MRFYTVLLVFFYLTVRVSVYCDSVPAGVDGAYGEAVAGFDGTPFFKPAPVFSPLGTVYFPQTSVPDESLRKFVMQQMYVVAFCSSLSDFFHCLSLFLCLSYTFLSLSLSPSTCLSPVCLCYCVCLSLSHMHAGMHIRMHMHSSPFLVCLCLAFPVFLSFLLCFFLAVSLYLLSSLCLVIGGQCFQ